MPIAPKHRPLQRGVTLIELMIAIAIGLFITAITIKVVVDRLADDRIHIAEIRLNQNLRAAADVIARDLRRAGYWEDSLSGIFSGDAAAPEPNPVAGIFWSELTALDYAYRRDTTIQSRQFQFRRADVNGVGVLQFSDVAQDNPVWQDLTDPTLVNILDEEGKRFSIQVVAPAVTPVPSDTLSVPGREVELFHFCPCRTLVPIPADCEDDVLEISDTRPRLVIRQFEIRIPARSVVEPTVERELVETVRVRNDALIGSCPPLP